MHVTLRSCFDATPIGMLLSSGDGLHAVSGQWSPKFIIYRYPVAEMHNTLSILSHIIYVFTNGDVKKVGYRSIFMADIV